MRPLYLSMSAFGPYASRQDLDFSLLVDRPLFLIHGPTGAGKTTILDAISFALYGDTSGAERQGKDMRSHYAEPSLRTEVLLEFELGSEIYRIHRSPEQERPKRRGEGSTVQIAEATLWQRTGLNDTKEEGKVLTTGWQKVTEAVENLLGFKSSQFRQVVMLPQGQFRKLLVADSRERQEILEALFRTETYRRIEEFFKEETKALAEELKTVSTREKWLLEQAKAANLLELELRIKEGKEKLTKIKEDLVLLKEKQQQSQDNYAKGQQLKTKFIEKKEAQILLSSWEARQEEMASKRKALNQALLAAGLEEAENHLQKGEQELKRLALLQEDKAKTVISLKEGQKKAEAILHSELAKEQKREEARLQVLRLQEFEDKVISLEGVRREREKAQIEVLDAQKVLLEKEENITDLEKKLETVSQQLEQIRKEVSEVSGLEDRCKEAERVILKRREIATLELELTKRNTEKKVLEQRISQNREQYLQAQGILASLQEAWQRGQASLLASQLTVGSACPVCGSLEHPRRAVSCTDVPSEKELKAQEEAVKELSEQQEKEQNNYNLLLIETSRLETRCQSLLEEVIKFAAYSLPDLEKGALKLKARYAQVQEKVGQEKLLVEQLENIKEQLRVSKEQYKKEQEALTKAQGILEGAIAIVKERETSVPRDLQDLRLLKLAQAKAQELLVSLNQALEKAQKTYAELSQQVVKTETELQGLQENISTLQDSLVRERKAFQNRLEEAGFSDFAAYSQAKLTKAEINTLDGELKAFETNLSLARERYQRAKEAVTGVDEPDIEQLKGQVEGAERAWQEVLHQEMKLQDSLTQDEVWSKELGQIGKKLSALEEKYQNLGPLAEVANGKNAYGLTFQRFVLGAFLDDVTAAASQRLRLMSRGRYFLQRTMDRASRRAAGGLELEVFDNYTGRERGVTSLSGGESFLASLALALGLADVVQSYAGGIRLDTVFVDEGFGTLDPEALDLAMATLFELQKGGRLVGIISHVPELKERIETRLEVEATERGSRAKFYLG